MEDTVFPNDAVGALNWRYGTEIPVNRSTTCSPCPQNTYQDEYRAEGNESLLGDSDFDGCRGHASSKCGGKHIAQVFRAVHEVLPLPPRAVHGLFGDPERDGRWCWFLVKQGCQEERQDNDKRRAPEQYDGCPEDTT